MQAGEGSLGGPRHRDSAGGGRGVAPSCTHFVSGTAGKTPHLAPPTPPLLRPFLGPLQAGRSPQRPRDHGPEADGGLDGVQLQPASPNLQRGRPAPPPTTQTRQTRHPGRREDWPVTEDRNLRLSAPKLGPSGSSRDSPRGGLAGCRPRETRCPVTCSPPPAPSLCHARSLPSPGRPGQGQVP